MYGSQSTQALLSNTCEIVLTLVFSRSAGIWDFNMAPADFAYKLTKGGTFRFTATITAGGVPFFVEIITGIRVGRPLFAVGFSFDRESFGKLSEKLSGIGVDFLDKLGVEFEVSYH